MDKMLNQADYEDFVFVENDNPKYAEAYVKQLPDLIGRGDSITGAITHLALLLINNIIDERNKKLLSSSKK